MIFVQKKNKKKLYFKPMSFAVHNSLSNQKESLSLPHRVKWYTCGPTVYDHAHIGHARNYIMNDVLRRVLTQYGFQIELAMNMTDIDDKIIHRAGEQQIEPRELAKLYEKSFAEDMEALNVLPPDVVTRVSEYMDKIVGYIEEIVQNGFAYQMEGTGSVYFDLTRYRERFPDNFQLKLVEEEMEHDTRFQKRHPSDFALWKEAKTGEPSWESPWGPGRPGWHIECSAMASDIFGPKFDIHSGGIDLRFPHHENEFKQANAHNLETGWVKYFLHIGHLHIEGLKMSKSLKNFITVKEILKRANSNQIRMLFLLHRYHQPMEYSEHRLEQAKGILEIFTNFFQNVSLILNHDQLPNSQRDDEMRQQYLRVQSGVDAAIRDDFDLPMAISLLQELVRAANRYVAEPFQPGLLSGIRNYVRKTLEMLGLTFQDTSGGDAAPVLDLLCQFRDQVRQYAFERKQFDLLKLTDGIRDQEAAKIGITIEDRSKTTSVWKQA
jgi:cysteinyl-tRNA synthetase